MKPIRFITVIATLIVLLLFSILEAQLQWRVSVKFILDADGNRADAGTFAGCCDLDTDAEVTAKIDTANAILGRYGRGYGFDLVEIIDVPGVSQWFDEPILRDTRNGIRDEAQDDPATYFWSTDAINVYILGTDGSGTAYDMVLLGQNLNSPNTPFHEFGHFFTLCHTFQCGCNGCDECPTPGDDEIDDTIEDSPCWGSATGQDSIANNAFGSDYATLTAEQQAQVDLVFYNLMCYRYRRERLSPGQLDRMTDASNSKVNHVATGRTHFVDDDGDPENQSGSSTEPYITVADGLEAAGTGDIVLIRAGTYDESLTIDQRIYLRASRGNAVIR